MNDLIKWLEAILIPAEWVANNEYRKGYRNAVKEILDKAHSLSRHSAEVEPLACLASKKGMYIDLASPCDEGWNIRLDGNGLEVFTAPTYAEAEAKAREWLNKQEDNK